MCTGSKGYVSRVTLFRGKGYDFTPVTEDCPAAGGGDVCTPDVIDTLQVSGAKLKKVCGYSRLQPR